MVRIRNLVSALGLAIVGTMIAAHAGAEPFVVDGPSAKWHSRNMELSKANLVPAKTLRLGRLAYDNHFLNTGRPPAWDFLSALPAPAPGVARLEDNALVFPMTGRRVVLEQVALPDIATPAAPFLLEVPGAGTVLVVQPYYLFRSKLTRYWVTAYRSDGTRGPRFDSLPTHVMKGAPDILVAPERAGCCENMTWSVRFYDLSTGAVDAIDCPAGRCGDLVLARPDEAGPLLLAFEVFDTIVGAGSVVETRLFVIAPNGKPLAAGRLAHATADSAVGTTQEWAACASRVLASEGTPYAVSRLTAIRGLDDGRWAVRFDTKTGSRTWTIDGVSTQKVPSVVFGTMSKARQGS